MARTIAIGTTDVGAAEVDGQGTVLDSQTGHKITNCGGKVVILFENGNAASRTVTIKANKTGFRAGPHGLILVNDLTVTVPAGVGKVCLVYPPIIDYMSNGQILFDGDANFADVTVSAWNLEER